MGKKKAMFIIDGDVFEYQGRTEVAISDYSNGFVWVSSIERYEDARKSPGYTNATLLKINEDAVVSYGHIPTIDERLVLYGRKKSVLPISTR